MSQGRSPERFVKGGHGAYPVIGRNGELVGIVSRSDVLGVEVDPDASLVDIMSTEVVTVGARDPAIDALHLIADERVEHIPVVDGDRLIGICTRTDLLKVRQEQRDLERPQAGFIAAHQSPRTPGRDPRPRWRRARAAARNRV
ncbi:MAG: CBS domain-containing protein [Ilumatobacteraceae bacterium]